MTDTLKTLFDILRLKSGPADLPTSPRLMWGLLGLLVALQALLGAWLMPEDKAILPQAIVSGLVTLAWIALLLRLFGHPERFLQTASAMLGIACLLAPVSIPLVSVVRPQAGQSVEFTPAVLLTLALSFFLVFINARILRAAIERPMFQCVVLFLLGEFLVFAVMLVAGFGGA